MSVTNISLPNTPVTAGTSINIGYTIGNIGLGNAPLSNTRFYLSRDNVLDTSRDIYTGQEMVSSINANGQLVRSLNLNLNQTLTAGNYYLIAVTDSDQRIPETRENNNIFVSANTIQINKAPKPDLAITNWPLFTTPLRAGERFSYTYTLTNETASNLPSANAGPSHVRFLLSRDQVVDANDIYIGQQSYGNMPAGSSVTRTVLSDPLNSSLAAGTYYLIAQVDAYNAVAEADEADNTVIRQVQVNEAFKPDLYVSNIPVTVPALGIVVSNSTSGINFDFNYIINNGGPGNAPPSTTRFYISRDRFYDAYDIYIGQDSVNALPNGFSSNENFRGNYRRRLNHGTYYIIAHADGAYTIPESNDTNNLFFQRLTVLQ